MVQWAHRHGVELWFCHKDIKHLWRDYHQQKSASRRQYLSAFYLLFYPALAHWESLLKSTALSPSAVLEAQGLLKVLRLLEAQTRQKLLGVTAIKDRLVSLTEVEARPLKKGKAFPPCEFGSTTQFSFNRQGFLITCEVFIGQPADTNLYIATLQQHIQRLRATPSMAVTDQGFRSTTNLAYRPLGLTYVFMGRRQDVPLTQQPAAISARSATEGFIAVAKNLRGFGKSLYRGLRGDKIWAALCQAAYNLKKFLQLYRQEAYEESVLLKLGV